MWGSLGLCAVFVIQNVCRWMESPGSDVGISRKGTGRFHTKHYFHKPGRKDVLAIILVMRIIMHIGY